MSEGSGPRRGFAGMSRERVREIARLGGLAAHRMGVAHRFTKEEASRAGVRGGRAAQAAGVAHRFDSESARAAGAKGLSARNRGKARDVRPSVELPASEPGRCG